MSGPVAPTGQTGARMSDAPQGPGWWQASDGRWYPPTARPGTPPPGPAPSGPPPYGPGPYGPSPYGYGYAPNPNGTPTGLPSVSSVATASMVLGIVSLVICCWPLVLCSLAGLPLGIYALTRISKGAADPGPKGQAIAGVVLNAISFAILAIFAVATVAT